MGVLDLRFRDAIARYLPPWLTERPTNGLTAAYRYVWGLVAPLDAASEQLVEGIAAWFPGIGTPTALARIGRSRGIVRNQVETDAAYAARLGLWLDTWVEAGSQKLLALAIHNFLSTHPRVRIVNRAQHWITVEADGTVNETDAAWDWDSVSHPERNDPDAPWWSDEWIIVQSPWAIRPDTLGDLTGDDGFGLGHLASRAEVDAIKGLISQWKAAHSRVRAVIWTTDASLFDPEAPATCPDGTWGAWGIYDGTSYVASGRDLVSTRFWEPR